MPGQYRAEPTIEPTTDDERRALTALFRRRARVLPRALPTRLGLVAQAAPSLLHASFDEPAFSAEAPGVVGLHYHLRWSALARHLGLSPPRRVQRGRCAVQAVFAVPTHDGCHIVAVVDQLSGPGPIARTRERLEAIHGLGGAGRSAIRVTALDADAAAERSDLCASVVLFGALLAGRISPSFWALLERTRGDFAPRTAGALALDAPTPLAALALTLLARDSCPGPLDAALALLRTTRAAALAREDRLLMGWAGLVPYIGKELAEASRLASAGRAASSLEELAQLVRVGRRLAWLAASTIRGAEPGPPRWTWRERVGPSLPRLLEPALGATLAVGRPGLRLDPARGSRAYEVRLADGTPLGRGANPAQARCRAVALLAQAGAFLPGTEPRQGFDGLDATWRALGQALARPRAEPTLLVMPVSGGASRPGPPQDLLNRGPARDLELDAALVVRVTKGRRPSAQLLPPEETVRLLLARAAAGAALEVIPSTPSARPVSARLAEAAALLRLSPSSPVAVEAGGRVFLRDRGRLRTFHLGRFAARPRRFEPDPDAPDISVTVGERRGPRTASAGVVQCRVTLARDDTAALLYRDAGDVHLREEVPLAELEEHLTEARQIVLAAHPVAVLAVRLSDGVEPALRRAGRRGARLAIEVAGDLPFVEARFGGDRFGGRGGLGWQAAAEALLSSWPAGGEGRIAVHAVTARRCGQPLAPLLALHASSVVRRRLRTHLLRAMNAYRTGAASRRAG